jgi:hypothetical protein
MLLSTQLYTLLADRFQFEGFDFFPDMHTFMKPTILSFVSFDNPNPLAS